MNGGADLGGMVGFGPVIDEQNEPVFHSDWEKRVMGVVIALSATGAWNIDQSRFARESLQPGKYFQTSYYEVWLEAAINLMLERGMMTEEELATGELQVPSVSLKRKLEPENVEQILNAGGPSDRSEVGTPKFRVDQPVRTINEHPDTHTRLPRYARDKSGTITRVHGYHVYPDSSAQGLGENPHWLYQVSFNARTLWGGRAGRQDVVTLDLWEPYLKVLL